MRSTTFMAERHTTQYFEMFCNRGIYHEGWTAVTRHSTPWLFQAELPSFDDDVWELYDTNTDWTQARNLAAEQPEKLAELQNLFMAEARKYNVYPLDDRRVERFNSDLAGRPTLIKGNSQLFFSGMRRLNENVVINVKNKSHAVVAEIEVPEEGRGVMIRRAAPSAVGFCTQRAASRSTATTSLAPARFTVEGETSIPPGTHQVRMEFEYDGGGLAKGGGREAVRGRRPGRPRPRRGHRADALLRRRDAGRRVRQLLGGQRRLHARGEHVHRHGQWVEIDIAEAAEDLDHLISPAERLAVAMARQ